MNDRSWTGAQESAREAATAADHDIAIVGMAARLPGARNIDEFWCNLRDGVESIVRYTDEELLAHGESPDNLHKPNYVRAGAPLADMEMFDGEFFGLSPKESAIMDPQHRHFLECCWEALEDAGHAPERFAGPIGVFGGCGMGSYFYFNVCTNRELVDTVGLFLLRHTGNDKDFLVTRVSHLFDLRGPSVNVQTACSTSLVAAHLACQSLLAGECDMALAGGVTIEIPHRRGYLYQEGEVLSPDGHCHAFDHRGRGTVFGSGAAVVVLRRLRDAIADGDHIHAVIKGSAINNDGAGKAGYLAPSVEGQAAAMAEAYAVAGISAGTIDYVECHGTGTYLGDPIEIAALTLAFRKSTEAVGFCRIGSVKTNIGHLDTAAGVASLIKVALALQHRQIPASLHYERPNPSIDFAASPFVVNDRLTEWRRRSPGSPRRAAVNSLGVGGTNAHMVVEEAPQRPHSSRPARDYQLLTMSARNRKALDAYQQRLAAHLRAHPELALADVAWSLHVGRRAFAQRRVLAARDREEAIRLLESNDAQRVFSGAALEKASTVFMFPGGGSQYPRMGLDLYRSEPLYREMVDRGLEFFRSKTGTDLRALMFPADSGLEPAAQALEHPRVQLPAIFIVEMALARLWMSWGIEPAAMIGHSMGENTAACVAGVLSYEDALGLVILRGELVERVAEGAMLSVPLPEAELEPMLGELGLELAIVNSPALCVASGNVAGIEALEARLRERGIETRRPRITVAAHSRMLDPILEEFGAYLRSIRLAAPKIPFVSNTTGRWISAEEATDPAYWMRHLRHTVRFSAGMKTLLETPERAFLEVGPGRILSSLVRQQPDAKAGQAALASLRHPEEQVSDVAHFLTVLGRLWASGVKFDLARLWEGERRLRVRLPAYAFQHQRYFIEPSRTQDQGVDLRHLRKIAHLDDWFYRPVWRPAAVGRASGETALTWLVFMDDTGLGASLVERLRKRGDRVIAVHAGDAYFRRSETDYLLAPERGREGYDALVKDLVAGGTAPNRIVHLWLVTREETFRPGSNFFQRNLERGFYSLLYLAQALGEAGAPRPIQITVGSTGMQQLAGAPLPYPEKATVLGPVRVIPREYPGITCRSVDIELPAARRRFNLGRAQADAAIAHAAAALEREALAAAGNEVVAWRQGERKVLGFERCPAEADSGAASRLREGGVYLITGGLGGLGLAIAADLAKRVRAKLVLLAREGLPERDQWESWLRSHGSDERTSRRIEKVQALEAMGAEVMIAEGDVTDVEAVRRAVEAARQRFDTIHGVIHAAGVVDDGLIQFKTMAGVEDVFAPKVHGTRVLDAALEGMDLDFMVLFSSVSTVVAPAGQVDYVAANAFLDAFAASRNRPDVRRRTLAINWGIWNEVGMAAEALLRPDPVKIGARGDAGDGAAQAEPAPRHPLFDRRTQDARGARVLAGRWRAATHWLLDEHRTLKGHALVPGTGYLELVRAALEEYGEPAPFELRDLFFFRPLHVADDDAREVRVKLRRSEEGYSVEVRARRTDEGRIGWELHAQAEVALHALAAPERLPVAEIAARCRMRGVSGAREPLASAQEHQLRLGPRWRVLHEARFGEGEAIAHLALAERYAPDLDAFRLHPALLDVATGYALSLIAGYDGSGLWVPVSYRRVRVYAPLARSLWSWVRGRPENSAARGIAEFDVVIADESGRVLVEVEGFGLKRIAEEVEFSVASRPSAAEIEYERAVEARPLSPAELQLQRNLRQGIRPAEGAEALARVLATPAGAQWMVSSLDLAQLVEQAAQAAVPAAGEGAAKFARPELDSEYVEPRDEIERTIVGFWRELLGVERIGVRDSFFDLGGHSLIAVRLFAMIKRAFQVDYPISVLFEAPTVERCAAMIREAISGAPAHAPATPGGAPPARAAHRPRYTHLVAMHSGEGGPRRPFFLVAGMFGNVLNLRHLAHLVGTDRPFYGLQARGLYGDATPHETFEDMGRDYLAEMRTVQPKGPYLLGGFSGGGITAYEMAQQLRAEGEEVALLVMLDTNVPGGPVASRAERLRGHLLRLRRAGPEYLFEWVRRRLRWERERLAKRLGQADGGERAPYELHNEAIEAAFRAAFARYRVAPYPGEIQLFRPPQDRAYVLGPDRVLDSNLQLVFHDNGWGRHAASVVVNEVPGTHDSMVLEPNVRVLARRLQECIRRAEAAIAHRAGASAASRPQTQSQAGADALAVAA